MYNEFLSKGDSCVHIIMYGCRVKGETKKIKLFLEKLYLHTYSSNGIKLNWI